MSGERCAGLARHQEVGAEHRRQAEGAVAREDVDDLGAEEGARPRRVAGPGRHDQVDRLVGAGRADRLVLARRRDDAAGEGLGQGIDEVGKGQDGVDRLGIDDPRRRHQKGTGAGSMGCGAAAVPATTARSRSASAL